jgi:hypothetical protein
VSIKGRDTVVARRSAEWDETRQRICVTTEREVGTWNRHWSPESEEVDKIVRQRRLNGE